MSLWIVVYVAGNIGMTVGPLPYGMDECLLRAAEKLTEINSDAAKADVARANGIAIKCEWQWSIDNTAFTLGWHKSKTLAAEAYLRRLGYRLDANGDLLS